MGDSLRQGPYLTIIYVRAGYVCLCVCVCVCPSTPPTVMNRLSWNFAGVMSLPPLKTGSKNFFDRTKKKFRNFWGIASGRGHMGMSALTILTRSSWNLAGVILSTVPLKAKKLLETKPFLLATDLWSNCHLEKLHFISYVRDRSSFGDPAPPVFWL